MEVVGGGVVWWCGLGVSGGVLLVCTPLHLATAYVWAQSMSTVGCVAQVSRVFVAWLLSWSFARLVLRFD